MILMHMILTGISFFATIILQINYYDYSLDIRVWLLDACQ
jgi:hypothetical protein